MENLKDAVEKYFSKSTVPDAVKDASSTELSEEDKKLKEILNARGIDFDSYMKFENIIRDAQEWGTAMEPLAERSKEIDSWEENRNKKPTWTPRDGYCQGKHQIYKEDIEMLEKSEPFAKRLIKHMKKEELPTGPDTTENIREEVEDARERRLDALREEMQQMIDEHRNEKPSYSPEDVKQFDDSLQYVRQEVQDIKSGTRQPESDGDLPFPGPEPYSFEGILRTMREIHAKKNSDYGGAAHQGYLKYGIVYYLVQLHNKLTRLESLTQDGKERMVNESIEDTLLDLANYAVLALESLKNGQ